MTDQNKRIVLLDRRQTGDDKEDINPFDTSPKSEAEAIAANEVQRECMRFAARLQVSRGWLTLQQLCDADWARVHFEGELPPVHGVNHGVFFFSIDGKHRDGSKFERCLLGDSLMVISAANRSEASKRAQEGLLFTIEQANAYAFAAEMGVDLTQQNPGVSVETHMPKRR